MLSLNQHPRGIFFKRFIFGTWWLTFMRPLFNIFETFFVEELSIVAVTLTRQGEIGVGWVQVDPSTSSSSKQPPPPPPHISSTWSGTTLAPSALWLLAKNILYEVINNQGVENWNLWFSVFKVSGSNRNASSIATAFYGIFILQSSQFQWEFSFF